jgi:hypothetical protein
MLSVFERLRFIFPKTVFGVFRHLSLTVFANFAIEISHHRMKMVELYLM